MHETGQVCRSRKVRCSGEQPCKNCRTHDTGCVYRKIRRARNHQTPEPLTPRAPVQAPISEHSAEPPARVSSNLRNEDIFHSVSATQSTAHSGNLQLYYGASSNFAFLQQLHRSLLLDDGSEIAAPGDVQEGSAGLDLFNQRALFFGTTTSSSNPGTSDGPAIGWDSLPSELLELFLNTFFDTLYHVVSFVRKDELCHIAHAIFNKRDYDAMSPGQRAVALAALTNGAISTEHLLWSERLYKAARIEAVDFDEVVNLHSVHYSILMAVYHNTMGRPNQSYLQLGSATRKAFAMGLHKDVYSGDASVHDKDKIQERRTTIWCLYFHEWYEALS